MPKNATNKDCPLTHAIKANPAIHTSWVHEFWRNAKSVEESKGLRYIQYEVAKNKFTINEDDIRRVLRIGDNPVDSVVKFKKDRDLEPFLKKMGYEGKLSSFDKKYVPPYWKALYHIVAQCLSGFKDGFDSLRLDWLGAIKALTEEMEFNFSRMLFNILYNHAKINVSERWGLYPRFIQLLIDDKFPNIARPVYEVEKDADGNEIPAKEPYHVIDVTFVNFSNSKPTWV